MRQIKFRVWDVLEKRFIYPDKEHRGHFGLTLSGEFYNFQNGSVGDNHVIQQYTGLFDQNGVELYEGDIVTYQIRLDDHGGLENHISKLMWASTWGAWSLGISEPWNLLSDYYIKINDKIGNVFENPEILENKYDC